LIKTRESLPDAALGGIEILPSGPFVMPLMNQSPRFQWKAGQETRQMTN
jgi:hypothetical protein